MDLPRAPGGGGRARRKSGIIMSELGANLKPLAPSAATVSPRALLPASAALHATQSGTVVSKRGATP